MAYKILFMGTPKFSVPVLKSLNQKHKILSVFTQPPKKKFRGQKIEKSPIHLEAEKLNLPVRFSENLNNEFDYRFIKESSVDFVIVVAYGQIIPDKFLNIKNTVFLNIHASLLPRWRGAAPIQRSIMEMDKETGVSIMKIIPKLDAGPYILQAVTKISSEDNSETLSNRLSEIGSKQILEALVLFENGEVKFKDQNEKNATYAKKISKKEAEINWNDSAQKIIAKINGLYPYPCVWFQHKGSRIKIVKAEICNNKGNVGEVLSDELIVGCKDKAIKINFLQKEGKKILDRKSFLAGYKILKGEVLI